MTEDITPVHRRRGRPQGSGTDDSRDLAAVADLLVANPTMKPTTAIKRHIRGVQASHLRRLQEKWKVQGPRLKAEAEARARRTREALRLPASTGGASSGSLGGISLETAYAASQSALARVSATVPGAAGKSMVDAAVRSAFEYANSPLFRVAHDVGISSAASIAREAALGPLAVAAREAALGVSGIVERELATSRHLERIVQEGRHLQAIDIALAAVDPLSRYRR